MAFENLSADMQNLIMLKFEFFGKLFLFICLFAVCIYIIHYKKNKESPYLIVAYINLATKCLSYVMLFISPLFLIFFYPQITIDLLLQFLFIFYIVAFFIIMTVFLVNIFYITPMLLIKIGGYNPQKERTNKILNSLSKFSSVFKPLKRVNPRDMIKDGFD